MPLECDVICDPGVEFPHVASIAELLQFAAQSEPAISDGRWQMTLRLSDDDAIAELHRRFFDDPTPTDVITFPSGEEPDHDGAYLGDVVVSVETAARQAQDAGHSEVREVAFLALHGLLHLCGYEDTTAAERDEMHRCQGQYLDDWEREWGQPW
jgi:probable rRNA maturation factor